MQGCPLSQASPLPSPPPISTDLLPLRPAVPPQPRAPPPPHSGSAGWRCLPPHGAHPQGQSGLHRAPPLCFPPWHHMSRPAAQHDARWRQTISHCCCLLSLHYTHMPRHTFDRRRSDGRVYGSRKDSHGGYSTVWRQWPWQDTAKATRTCAAAYPSTAAASGWLLPRSSEPSRRSSSCRDQPLCACTSGRYKYVP